MTAPVGARLEDWKHFGDWLNLSGDLLPVVPDESATPTAMSKVKRFGKIPSLYNAEGHAHGIPDWTTLPINDGNIAHWREDRRYSLCLRLGQHSGCYAIDVDVDDFDLTGEIADIVAANRVYPEQPLPVRSRLGTCKYLLLFRLNEPLAKIIIDWGRKDSKGKPERIEILGDGQQCVIAGSHPSGVLYQWNDTDNVPWEIPTLMRPELDAIVAALSKRFGTSSLATGATASVPATGVAPSATGEEVLSSISTGDLADLEDALRYQPLIDSASSNDVWAEVGMALLSLGEQGRQLFVEFSSRAPNGEYGDADAWWEAHQ